MRTIDLPKKQEPAKKSNLEREMRVAAAYRKDLETPSTEHQLDPYGVSEIDRRPNPLYRPKQ
jgi:hypothetical protein